jgi:hypothetical protein
MEGRQPRPAPSATACLEPPCRDGEGMGALSVPAQPPAPTWNLLVARAPAMSPECLHTAGRPLPHHRSRRARLEQPELSPSGSPGLRRGREGHRPRHPPRLHGAGQPCLPRHPPTRRPAGRSIPHAACATSSRHRDRLVYSREGRGADHGTGHSRLPRRPLARRRRPDPARHQLPVPESGVVSLRREGCLPSPLSPSGARGQDPRRQRKELLASDVD